MAMGIVQEYYKLNVKIMLETWDMLATGGFWNTFSFTNNHKNNELRTAQKPESHGYFFQKESISRI